MADEPGQVADAAGRVDLAGEGVNGAGRQGNGVVDLEPVLTEVGGGQINVPPRAVAGIAGILQPQRGAQVLASPAPVLQVQVAGTGIGVGLGLVEPVTPVRLPRGARGIAEPVERAVIDGQVSGETRAFLESASRRGAPVMRYQAQVEVTIGGLLTRYLPTSNIVIAKRKPVTERELPA